MYMLKNKVQLIGCLGRDPEVKITAKGKKWARLLLATHENYRNDKGEHISETQWHTLIAWGKLAELAEKCLRKGKQIAVEGKLVNRSFVDKHGITRKETDIILTDILMLGPRPVPSVIDVGKEVERRA